MVPPVARSGRAESGPGPDRAWANPWGGGARMKSSLHRCTGMQPSQRWDESSQNILTSQLPSNHAI